MKVSGQTRGEARAFLHSDGNFYLMRLDPVPVRIFVGAPIGEIVALVMIIVRHLYPAAEGLNVDPKTTVLRLEALAVMARSVE